MNARRARALRKAFIADQAYLGPDHPTGGYCDSPKRPLRAFRRGMVVEPPQKLGNHRSLNDLPKRGWLGGWQKRVIGAIPLEGRK